MQNLIGLAIAVAVILGAILIAPWYWALFFAGVRAHYAQRSLAKRNKREYMSYSRQCRLDKI